MTYEKQMMIYDSAWFIISSIQVLTYGICFLLLAYRDKEIKKLMTFEICLAFLCFFFSVYLYISAPIMSFSVLFLN